MKYLLDTHVWLWALLEPKRLSRKVASLLANVGMETSVALSAISLKEAAWHLAHGRIVVTGGSWADWLRQAATAPGLAILPLTVEVAIASETLVEPFPADPADRMIAATAQVHGLTLVTRDEPMRESGVVAAVW